MKQLTPSQNLIYRLGALFMLIGAASFLFSHIIACSLFVVGVLLFAYIQTQQTYEGSNILLKRLRRQQLFSLCCIVLSAILMTMLVWDLANGSFLFRFSHHNEWVIFLGIGAIIQLYTAFRIPVELEKEQR